MVGEGPSISRFGPLRYSLKRHRSFLRTSPVPLVFESITNKSYAGENMVAEHYVRPSFEMSLGRFFKIVIAIDLLFRSSHSGWVWTSCQFSGWIGAIREGAICRVLTVRPATVSSSERSNRVIFSRVVRALIYNIRLRRAGPGQPAYSHRRPSEEKSSTAKASVLCLGFVTQDVSHIV